MRAFSERLSGLNPGIWNAVRKLLSCSNPVAAFLGAGPSVDSGLATFRDPDALWSCCEHRR